MTAPGGEQLSSALAAAVSDPRRVRTRPIDLHAYASDASFYRLVPRAVVLPTSEQEVQALFAVARATRVPITFRAAGTSLSGQAGGSGVLLDISRHFDRFELLDGGARVRLGPGLVGGRVNARLARLGRRIGPDPASIDACMIGGILANNASGMCCGVSENAYHTLASLRFVLPSGLVVDTALPDAGQRLREGAPLLHAGLLELRQQVLADGPLLERIRAKYRMKNTVGYGLNALVDFEQSEDILAHLLVGSEGTLAFISEAVLHTLPEYPARRTGLLYFASAEEAMQGVLVLARSGARAIELLDEASLRSVASEPALGVDVHALPAGAVALLVEYQCADEAALAALAPAEEHALAQLHTLFAARLTSDPSSRAALWHIRKGLYPAVGATKRSGETAIIEDVAFPLERLAPAVGDLRALLVRHGYGDAIIFGHAKDGNVHFVIKQSFNEQREIDRYARFMDGLCELVVRRHDGALKAEHGTGRNVAPFVEAEWGREAYALMRRIKAWCDPDGILNPGVLLSDDSRAHVTDLKSLPTIDPEVDRCVECGFCEAGCPSGRLTLTPRQRIAIRRELARQGGPTPTAESLVHDFEYSGLDTCATDGLCAVACPVQLDTGSLVKRLRSERRGRLALAVAAWIATHPGVVEACLSFAVRAAHLLAAVVGARRVAALSALAARGLGVRLPSYSSSLPRPAGEGYREHAPTASPAAVYVPSCTSRMLGKPAGEERSLPEVVATLAERAGVALRLPLATGQCCGLALGSKGFGAGQLTLLARLVDLLWVESDEGRLPVAIDASSCVYGIKAAAAQLDPLRRERLARLRVLDVVQLARELLLPRLSIRRLPLRVALHPNCAARKLDLTPTLWAVAAPCASEIVVPLELSCCGTAGDRGLSYPELPASALAQEKAELEAAQLDGYYCSNPSCEIGMSQAMGLPWRSVLYLLEEASRPEAH